MKIDDYAFHECKLLESPVLNEAIERIGEYSFCLQLPAQQQPFPVWTVESLIAGCNMTEGVQV
eukprot:scaffold4023_cov101-Cylindrotheca_fusiformis.AAC.1